MNNFDYLEDAVAILESGSTSISHNVIEERNHIRLILEDATSPVTQKYIEQLYQSVLDKKHIDFGDIPNSKGDITAYSGYNSCKEVISNITNLAKAQNVYTGDIATAVSTVNVAIMNMEKLKDVFTKGFNVRNDLVMNDYNLFTYTIVQTVTGLLYTYVDYIKFPGTQTLSIKKNSKRSPEIEFYLKALEKFNNVVATMNYEGYLRSSMIKGKEQFIGTETLVGIGVVTTIALAIVPLSRELVYNFYKIKSNLSDALEQQAKFLEYNRVALENNTTFEPEKKKEIIQKQDKIMNTLRKLSDKLKVDYGTAYSSGERELNKDNSRISLDKVNLAVSDEPFSLL